MATEPMETHTPDTLEEMSRVTIAIQYLGLSASFAQFVRPQVHSTSHRISSVYERERWAVEPYRE
jgi:hypothetical protein